MICPCRFPGAISTVRLYTLDPSQRRIRVKYDTRESVVTRNIAINPIL